MKEEILDLINSVDRKESIRILGMALTMARYKYDNAEVLKMIKSEIKESKND